MDLKLNLFEIKCDLASVLDKTTKRGLFKTAKWAAELSLSLSKVNRSSVKEKVVSEEILDEEYDRYCLAKTYFDLKEYDRAAFFTKGCTSGVPFFIHMYSRYLSGEKKRLDDSTDFTGTGTIDNDYLKDLRVDLQLKYKRGGMDGFCLYLYAIVLKKLDLLKEAIEMFVECVNAEPMLWCAWLELGLLVNSREMVSALELPSYWTKHFFLAQVYLELQLNEDALKIYQALYSCGFAESSYIKAQTALAYHNLRLMDFASKEFMELQEMDPYRLENMDIYSNLLYVKDMRKELASLAHHCCDVDKYRVETCCVIGNYYSVRGQHDKAVMYFNRALKLNPNYLSAWTLMGHEYMELKNTPAAIQAYRHAIEANRRDYRAWYGLGQTYELLKMPLYCLYYYRKAQMLRPNDSRMIVALGEAYEKLDRLQEAKKCFWKAHVLGDIEGSVLIKLARLYERLFEEENAAEAYALYIFEAEKEGPMAYEEISGAYRFLANYYIKQGRLDDAYAAAQKCTEFSETKEEGKALLKHISQLRQRGVGTEGEVLQGPPGLLRDPLGGPPTSSRLALQDPQNTPQARLQPFHLRFTP